MSVLIGATAAGAVLATVQHVTSQAQNYSDIANKSNSLVRESSAARVEPTVLVDSSISALPVMTTILQTNLNLFVGFYLQALQLSAATDIAGATVRQVLAPMNPNRDPSFAEFRRSMGLERAAVNYSVEAFRWALPGTVAASTIPAVAKEAEVPVNATVGKDGLNDVANLAVGKIIDVSIGSGEKKVTIPLSFRLMTVEMAPSVFEAISTDESANKSMSSRWNDVKDGRISFIDDFLLCKDLIRARKKMLMQDKAGIYTEIQRRAAQHKKAGLVSGKRSLAEASNIIVLDLSTVNMMAEKHGIDIRDFNQRQAIFDRTGCMMLTVVNVDHERVTFYYDSIRQGSSLGWGDLKVASKSNGPNIMDIFAAMNKGSAPAF